MQPGKKRQTRLHFHHHIVWKDKLHSCEFVTEEVGQNIQPKSAKATHLRYHAEDGGELLMPLGVSSSQLFASNL